MCKIAYARTTDGTAYQRCIDMIKFQENVVAGQSTGLTFKDSQGFHTRKAIGKVNSFMAKYPDIPTSDEVLGHSRFASVGVVNLENQHPIPIIVNGHKIGYGVHNGTWMDYENYEHMRSDIENKTDSGLLFTIYGKYLDKVGDTPVNRRTALGYIMSLLTYTRNIVIMFKNGQVIFTGNGITFKEGNGTIGIMSFGFENNCDPSFIYEVKGYKISKFETMRPQFMFEPKIPKPKLILKQKKKTPGDMRIEEYKELSLDEIPEWDTEMKQWEREMMRDRR